MYHTNSFLLTRRKLVSLRLFCFSVSYRQDFFEYKYSLTNPIFDNTSIIQPSSIYFLLSTPKTMASSLKAPTTTPALQMHSKQSSTPKADEMSMRHYSDDLVTGHIYAKHRDDDTAKIDLSNYISVIESIITTADRITDTVHRVKTYYYIHINYI